MEAALTLITEEFCVASGAKLNTRKTRTLSSHTQGPDITKSLRSRCLKGAEWVRSLGAVYSENVLPTDTYTRIIEKITIRMTRLQHRKPSLIARVLYANTLLSSCLWYFTYFIIPTKDQLTSFDKLVKGMLWSKKPGEVNAPVLISMPRMAAPKKQGGMGVIMPSDMAPAI